MNAVRSVFIGWSRVWSCALVALCGVAIVGCGSSGPTVVRTSQDAALVRSVTRVSRVSITNAHVSGRQSVAEHAKLVAVAAARRSAAMALSARHEAAASQMAHKTVRRLSKARTLAAERAAKAYARVALTQAKKLTALAVKADPSSCLKRSGVLTASRTSARSMTRAQALRVRALVLKCLSASQAAAHQAEADSSSPQGPR